MSSTEEQPTPDAIFQVAMGFMASKHLFVANEVGLFRALGAGPATLDSWLSVPGCPRVRPGLSPTRWSRSASSNLHRTATGTEQSLMHSFPGVVQ